jgi:hypothetical protein
LVHYSWNKNIIPNILIELIASIARVGTETTLVPMSNVSIDCVVGYREILPGATLVASLVANLAAVVSDNKA